CRRGQLEVRRGTLQRRGHPCRRSSVRMGGYDKLRIVVGCQPLLAWTVAEAAQAATVRRIIVVSAAARVSDLAEEPWIQAVRATVVKGGARRQDSVAAGVAASDAEVVLIHDGARPLARAELFDRVLRRGSTPPPFRSCLFRRVCVD
ncbi:MAG: 2-C-methyl-D-erythritol 4-phosphate cytidylyltransferase, partial [Candidatus Nanopelagicales bacterium]